jgi:hypothetical protein
MPTTERSPDWIFDAIARTHELLRANGIWHCVTYGTLLGAVREGDVIAWDHDFDMFIRPADMQRILGLGAHASSLGLELATLHKAGAELAMGSRRVPFFDAMRIVVFADGHPAGDLYAPTLFADGVLRVYDLASEVLWTPHSSFPHFFVRELGEASIRDLRVPAVGFAEDFLEGTYGADWRTPRRAVVDGGEASPDVTTHGDRYEPRLAEQIAWCLARGWDQAPYAGSPAWPRAVRGAGPVGPTARTERTSRALWWTDLEELVAHY